VICRGHLGDHLVVINHTERTVTVSLDEREVMAWDRAGRLYSVWRRGRTYRRGLNGCILEKWWDGDGRHRGQMALADAERLVDGAASRARHLGDAIDRSGCRWQAAPETSAWSDLRTTLTRAAVFDSQAARRDAAQFSEVYQPIGILPPDQYLALVVQATRGCSFGTCTFCDFYHQTYRVRTPAEFRRHLTAVRAFLGDSLLLRGRSIFLGAANVLAVPTARLVPLFELLADLFDGPARGVGAFLDAFSGVGKDEADYRALAQLGLRRVYVGLESGHDPLLRFVRKPGTAADAIATVNAVRSAGVSVGVIVLVGLGGDRFDQEHASETAAILNRMALGPGDLIYLSDLVEMPGTRYPALAADASIRALTAEERLAQRQRIQAALVFAGARPRIAAYDVREFVY
jgi:hypothetical protein